MMRTFCKISLVVLISLLQLSETGAFEFTVNQFKHAKIIKKEDLPGFKNSKTVSVLYYFQKDNPRHRGFYFEYDKSAEYLGLYNLELGVVDCRDPENADVDKCSQDDSPLFVYTYSHGNELLPLEIETMFDVNSMMSNILQLVLLRDVPILQSEKEIESFVNKNKGNSDLVFSFQKAIGTYEHRIFMEVAYAFHHKFKFAISTALKAVEGLPSAPDSSVDAKIWMMKCSDVTDDSDCFTTLYDEKMDLSSLANFMRRLDLPAQFDIPGNGTSHPYSPDLGLHLIYLFYRRTTEDSVQEMLHVAGNQFHGKAAFISIDVEQSSAKELGIEFPPVTPSLAVQFKSQGPLAVMSDPWSLDSAFEFFANKLHEYNRMSEQGVDGKHVIDEVKEDTASFPGEEEQRDRYSEEVETEDDHVAEAVQRARRIKMDIELATGLTDQTFESTIKEKDIVFILFYFPFDHRSLAFLRAYGEAARKFENQTDRPYTYVNCHDWTDVCAKENITRYPTLKIYQHGKYLKDFGGMLSTEDVLAAYQLLKQEKPVSLVDKPNIESFLNGVLPDGSNITGRVFVVGLFASAQSKGVQTYQDVAKKLGDKLIFGINSNGNGKDFMKIYGCNDLPCMVILKRTDIVQPYVVYKGDVSSAEGLTNFIEQSSTATFAELTPSIFPRLYKQSRPFVISFVDDTEMSKEMLEPVQSLVQSGSFPDLIFCSLQSGDINSFGRQILQTYHNSTSSSVPALSYAHLKKGKVYNYMDKSFSKEQIESWLRDIQSESTDTPAQFLLKEGRFEPRLPGYHFLDFIKEDEAAKKKTNKVSEKPDPEVLAANLHGIGFDSEGNEVEGANERQSSQAEDIVDDSEIRKELIDLQKSRLYHHAEGKHKPPHKKHPTDQSESSNIQPTAEDQGPNIPAPQDTTSTSAGSTTPPPKKSIIHDDL